MTSWKDFFWGYNAIPGGIKSRNCISMSIMILCSQIADRLFVCFVWNPQFFCKNYQGSFCRGSHSFVYSVFGLDSCIITSCTNFCYSLQNRERKNFQEVRNMIWILTWVGVSFTQYKVYDRVKSTRMPGIWFLKSLDDSKGRSQTAFAAKDPNWCPSAGICKWKG